ncbi:choline ABC transporter ATP-binding protein [Kaustia mangrovi]|uniref:Trimethylamine N-oxide transport system ATP-binding protein TmoW n=1 Tax=Kaustia mangrovi TaxID=2593653 RepID=A0A7S8HBJ4_9HYPH|nr:choline ABC transporter ATP-binding protein [Kaustia mangrovi]QPC42268.1 choline ABC transporter ATP-binding protein [Kaustia mangrovi]
MTSRTAVSFRHVDIVFGDEPKDAVALLDEGASRAEILEKTGHVIGMSDATLDVEEGEICVLMGLSGSGKSTLIRAVNGLNRPVRGEVLVRDGDDMVDVTQCNAATLRRLRMQRVAMVFQQFALFPWRTVAENVGFGLELAGVPELERGERVHKQLALVHLDQWSGKYAHELSGGMQQRVGLARAFATDAPILLMDEPFSALDPLIRTHLQDELLELQQTLRKTIVFVSHDLDEALKIGNRIAILEEGRIVQYGAPQEIVLNPANEYVAEFVAHMNPLNVLDGAALMTGLDGFVRTDGRVVLDPDRGLTVEISAAGVPRAPELAGEPVALRSLEETLADKQAARHALVNAPVAASMREIIEARRATGLPVLLSEQGAVVGVVRDEEIYDGILKRSAAGGNEDAREAGSAA